MIGQAIEEQLDIAYNCTPHDKQPDGEPVIVAGDAQGADEWARLWTKHYEYAFERHLADWKLHGEAAGRVMNQVMVDKGAWRVLAFPKGESRGTRDCINRAKAAGLEVIVYEGDRYDIS